MTSSKRSRFLRISKLRASTLPCAVSSALLSQRWVSASSSAMPFFCTQSSTLLLPKMRIRSSSSDRKNFDAPGIALAARAAAQLVVDAPALVALGADHVEAARLEHDLAIALDAGAGSPPPCGELGLARAHRRATLAMISGSLWRSQHLDVAAELDVGAAAGHVGGDGDGARPAGLGDDLRLPARGSARSARCAGCLAFFSSSDSASDFSIETVPTSIGWLRARGIP